MNDLAVQLGPEQGLSAVLSVPQQQRPVGVLLLNAGLVHRIGPFRMNVQLARAIADQGFAALRLDFSGLGYSKNPLDFDQERENIRRDIKQSIQHMKDELGIEQVVLLGLCSGADNAYRAALEFPQVTGVVMFDGYAYPNLKFRINHYLRRIGKLGVWVDWLRAKRRALSRPWRSADTAAAEGRGDLWEVEQPDLATFRQGIGQLVERGTRLLMIYSGGMIECNYEKQLKDTVPEARSDAVTVTRFGAADHTYILSNDRRAVVDCVISWLTQNFGEDK